MAAREAAQTEGSDTACDTDAEDDVPAYLDETSRLAIKGINATVRRCAQWAGFWPDGARYNSSEANWKKHALTTGFTIPMDDPDPEAWLNSEVLNRVNLSTAYSAKYKGAWPDGTAFTGLIDYFSISANLAKGLNHRASDEHPGPPGLPWWIVRKLPP